MKTIETEVPEQLYKKAKALVQEGWFRDEKDVFSEAIRRFLTTHQSELMEKFVRDDIEWGLHGND
ncbi:MAG: CopG family transcriptional regulator [Deltaproteobacteria bacterium]|nr:CopG family transcriptional regulator [Deltaproteobacteria bacterium]MBW2075470.1 CopG family transcriptional regulator [Deltaproteobacteria bacterium]RLB81547.1 MAG: CopG family transcriptional regulator [Deltaproteobacteria bacterium]